MCCDIRLRILDEILSYVMCNKKAGLKLSIAEYVFMVGRLVFDHLRVSMRLMFMR